jgi:hypothetical protein
MTTPIKKTIAKGGAVKKRVVKNHNNYYGCKTKQVNPT